MIRQSLLSTSGRMVKMTLNRGLPWELAKMFLFRRTQIYPHERRHHLLRCINLRFGNDDKKGSKRLEMLTCG
jgi:hypothetical protein